MDVTEPLAKEKPPFSYNLYKTDVFVKSFRKLDRNVQKMLDSTIKNTLSAAPFETKKLVSPELKGKRSLRKGDYRIIFAVCEECTKLNEARLNRCENCSRHEPSDIVIFMCGHRKHIYDA
jgi:mRNA-degrading endonuclease RelE of RelBE toxin-antitoxin system